MLRSALISLKNGVKGNRRNDESFDSGDVKMAIGGGFGIPKMKEYKLTLKRSDAGRSSRKRKDVDYSAMGGDQEDGQDEDARFGSESDSESPKKKTKTKKAKGINLEGMGKTIGPTGASLITINRRKYKVAVKEGGLKRQFHLPTIRREGREIEFTPSFQALGTRFRMEIPPRPLHDPMGESAIVLFDPTVDDIELIREQDRLQKLQADAEAKLTQDEQAQSGNTSKNEEVSEKLIPDQTIHKNLADILGIRRRDSNAAPLKVPVVIDPKLSAILRPHQVEGVRVSRYMHPFGLFFARQSADPFLSIQLDSFYTDALQV